MGNQKLSGKVAIVTGGARGFGKATVLKLVQEGARVVVNDVRKELADALVAEIIQAGGKAFPYIADVSDEKQVNDMVSSTVEKFGTVDILVNNAGIMRTTRPMETIPLSEFQAMIATNVIGVFLCMKAVMPIMKAKRSGKIVNISSSAGRCMSSFCGAHYSATKAAILGLSRHSANEAAPFNININIVAPGTFVTEGALELMPPGLSEGQMAEVEQLIPIRRFGKPQDLANLVAFLCSEESAYITGATVDINGGELMM